MKRLAALLALVVPALGLAATTTWNIDPAHTQSTFAVKHLVISTVRGEFKKTTGTVKIDDQDPASDSVEATIDASSIFTREDKRDAHLKSPDFFDVARYPTITFRSTRVEKAPGDGKYKITGDLTMHGVTKPVVLDATLSPEIKDPAGKSRRGVQATTRLNRQDYGLKWNMAVEAGPVVGDEITIELNAEMVKQGPAEAASK
jgi:polyisoprenoid-binding protein YceI